MHRLRPGLALLLLLGWAGQALAWGSTGHRLVAQAALQALPPETPAFMRTGEFAVEVAEIARDPDRSRKAGRVHDSDRDPAHFIDSDLEGKVPGGLSLDALPPTLEDYDTALRVAGSNSWKAGYLPYAIIDGWQQLVKDLALWRADAAGERLTTDKAHKAWLTADRRRRELLVARDLGIWAHFVGDGSYPLHVTSHYDGWGPGPNPNGYTLSHVHVPLEGPYVAGHVTLASVAAGMAPYQDCQCAVEARTGRYLLAGAKLVEAFYALEKAGGFKEGDGRGVAFMTDRIAAGAGELRDLTVMAWQASSAMSVGYPTALPAADFEAGKVADPYALLHSND
ncbi:MAG TPA: S1/P1 Nuclease [Caulobacteraceae bacterium]|nr:S1/P1 Nuclease [Caulobacteraceae bacterium]